MREPLRRHRPVILKQRLQLPQPGAGKEGARPQAARADFDQTAVQQTGGTGFFDPSFKLGPFDSDQNIIVDSRRKLLFAPNGGSNSVSSFSIDSSGALALVPGSPFRTAGINPLSLGLQDDSLIVVNGDENPAQPAPGRHPSYSLARILGNGALRALPGSSFILPDGSAPGQALTTNTGPFIFTQEFLGGTLHSFFGAPFGVLVALDKVVPPHESGETMQPKPLGLWASPNAPILYVGLVNVSRIGVFRWNLFGQLHFVRSVADPGVAVCWLRVTRAGTRLYAVNTGDSTISVYDTTDPADPVLLQNASVQTNQGGALFQFSLSTDEHFLYVLEQAGAAGASNRVHVLAVDRTNGTLTENVNAITTLPVPADTRSVGMIVF